MQTILFTMDDAILELVADNDQTFEVDAMDELPDDEDLSNRPSTADAKDDVSSSFSVALPTCSMVAGLA